MFDHLPLVTYATTPSDAERGVGRMFASHRLTALAGQDELRVVHRAAELSDGVTLGTLSYGVPVHIRVPTGLDGLYVVVIVLEGVIQAWHGDQLVVATPSQPLVLHPGDQFVKRWSSDCTVLFVRITQEALERRFRCLVGRGPRGRLHPNTRIDFHRSPLAHVWVQAVQDLTRRWPSTGGEDMSVGPAEPFDWILDGPLYAGPLRDDSGAVAIRQSQIERVLPTASRGASALLLQGESFGELLRRRRGELDLSQRELASLLAVQAHTPVSAQRVSDWERDAVMIGHRWIPYVSLALRMELDVVAGAAERSRVRRRAGNRSC